MVESKSSEKPALHVCTVATHPNIFLAQLVHSCKQNGISIDILAMGQPFTGYAMKFLCVQEYIKKLPDTDVVMFVDAYDVLVLANADTILDTFYKLDSPLIISAEKVCYPDSELAGRYPKTATSFQYVNSGTYIGYVWFLKKLFQEISPFQADENDQRLLSQHYIKHQSEYTLDTNCEIFLTTYRLPQDKLVLDTISRRVTCLETNSKPLVIHGNSFRHHYQHIYDSFFGTPAFKSMTKVKEDKTVFLAILANDNEYTLPKYLQTLEELDYKKKLITLYIRTYNNSDNSCEILKNWAQKQTANYNKIIFDDTDLPLALPYYPNVWIPQRYKIGGNIRNESLQVARDHPCDYYFAVDLDNFITPGTLQELMSQDKPILAPMLHSVFESAHISTYDYTQTRDETTYSGVCHNFFSSIDSNGQLQPSLNHFEKLIYSEMGTFRVPVVFGTTLIQSKYLNQLSYLDTSGDPDFIVFSRNARLADIAQYMCNDKDFGVFLYLNEFPPTGAQKTILQTFLG